jgi:hypothetical protein
MTINDIMMRDMAEADRQQKHEDEMREYDRKVRFRLWRRRFHAAISWAGAALAVATLAFLAWCCVSDAAHVFNISR